MAEGTRARDLGGLLTWVENPPGAKCIPSNAMDKQQVHQWGPCNPSRIEKTYRKHNTRHREDLFGHIAGPVRRTMKVRGKKSTETCTSPPSTGRLALFRMRSHAYWEGGGKDLAIGWLSPPWRGPSGDWQKDPLSGRRRGGPGPPPPAAPLQIVRAGPR